MEDYSDFDQGSFFLGMMEAFSEVVMQKVKKLAFSPVMETEMWVRLRPAAQKVFEKFGVCFYVERDLISSDLAPGDAVKGKIIVLIYLNIENLEIYKELKD